MIFGKLVNLMEGQICFSQGFETSIWSFSVCFVCPPLAGHI